MNEKIVESCGLLTLELKLVAVTDYYSDFFLSSVNFLGSLLNIVCSEVCLYLFEDAYCSIWTVESHEMVWAPEMVQVFNAS